MISPELPENEEERQKAVEEYRLLDTLPEPDYDGLTLLAAHMLDAPVSLITMLDRDRNFLKSHHGVDISESPRKVSFCGHAINAQDDVFVINNALEDERFADNPLVTGLGVRSYAGVPLVSSGKYRLGTLCVFDMKPREFSESSLLTLKTLARQVECLLELRHHNLKLTEAQELLEQRNKELYEFSAIVAHDIKTPLIGVTYLSNDLSENYAQRLGDEGSSYVGKIQEGVGSTLAYIDGILGYYTSDSLVQRGGEQLEVNELVKTLKSLIGHEENTRISFSSTTEEMFINRSAILQVLLNLITNSIKYNNNDPAMIEVDIEEDEKAYTLTVKDNGIGIPPEMLDTIFDLYVKSDETCSRISKGTGIGLCTVRKLVNKMGGQICVEQTSPEGTTMVFDVAKI
jgi:signal transduction histidine kinase